MKGRYRNVRFRGPNKRRASEGLHTIKAGNILVTVCQIGPIKDDGRFIGFVLHPTKGWRKEKLR